MDIEEIRKGAPKGATHYDTDKLFGLTYWKINGDLGQFFYLGGWTSGEGVVLKRTMFGEIYIGSFFDRLYIKPL